MSADTQQLFQQQVNLYRLQELVDNIVVGSGGVGPKFVVTEDVIKRLHKVATQKLISIPGEYRTEPVYLTNSPHVCPAWIEVPNHMVAFCQYLKSNWQKRDMVHLGAFALWRMCWIHPFVEGNGRTARATSYMTMCLKHGKLLPAKNSVVSQIVTDRSPYYASLREADEIYKTTQDIDAALRGVEVMLSGMLVKQLQANGFSN